MVNQAFRIKIAYRRRRKKPGIGRYPMGPTKIKGIFLVMSSLAILLKDLLKSCQTLNSSLKLVCNNLLERTQAWRKAGGEM